MRRPAPVGRIVDSLSIKVDQIEEARQPFARTLPRPYLEEVFADAAGFEPRGTAEFLGHVTKLAGSSVLLEGSAEVTVTSDCRRCLREVETAVPVRFTLNLVLRRDGNGFDGEGDDDGEAEKAGTFADNDADEEYYDGDVIAVKPILREQILLALPAIEPLCRDECKGLCTTCGQDLNERDCGHSQKAPDPRWTALRDLKL